MARTKYDSIQEVAMETGNVLGMVTVTAAALSQKASAEALDDKDLLHVMWVLNDKLTAILEYLQSPKVKAWESGQ